LSEPELVQEEAEAAENDAVARVSRPVSWKQWVGRPVPLWGRLCRVRKNPGSGLQPLDELRLEDLVDERALLDKDGFNGAIGRVIEKNAVPTNAEAVVAREIGFQ
jgi:hypothetical protein